MKNLTTIVLGGMVISSLTMVFAVFLSRFMPDVLALCIAVGVMFGILEGILLYLEKTTPNVNK